MEMKVNSKMHPIKELKREMNKGRFHIHRAQVNHIYDVREKIHPRFNGMCVKATNCLRLRTQSTKQNTIAQIISIFLLFSLLMVSSCLV